MVGFGRLFTLQIRNGMMFWHHGHGRPRPTAAAKEGGWQGSIMRIHPKESTKSGSMTESWVKMRPSFPLSCRVQCAVVTAIGSISLPLLDCATHPATSNIQVPWVPVSAIQRTEVPTVKLNPKRA